jgi:hypothetical protein
MKVLVESRENEGLDSFLGKQIAVWCLNYIYAGKLVGINDKTIKLEDAHIVYETGAFDESGWRNAQRLPGDSHYISIAAMESFGHVK